MPKKLMARSVSEPVCQAQTGPLDWTDIKGWDRHYNKQNPAGPFELPTRSGLTGWESVRFLNFAKAFGRKIWFPGCGTDVGPRFYAGAGFHVLATDFSPAAVRLQKRWAALPTERMFDGWSAFVPASEFAMGESKPLEVAEHDFTSTAPEGVFDAVINRFALEGLSPSPMLEAAGNFFTALRPGGVAIIDTVNVQGDLRSLMEDCLLAAGFFIPFWEAKRWYQTQLQGTGIPFSMVMGRPRVRYNRNNSVKGSMAAWGNDQSVLDSFTEQYKARVAAEQPMVDELSKRPETIVAHLFYPDGV